MKGIVFCSLLVVCYGAQTSESNGHMKEYCLRTNSESFEAKCLKNEVIVMTHARYGRMRIGSCLESEGRDILEAFANDRRFLGCSVDILSLLDHKCSGRNHCEIRGTDDDLQYKSPCHTALKSYLEASYYCAFVVDGDRTCQVKVSSTTQYVKPMPKFSTKCGSKDRPWRLEAPMGQQINVNLLELEDPANVGCRSRGYLFDKSAKRNTTLCPEFGERFTSLITSETNTVELVLSDQIEESSKPDFLIQFAAIGCTNVLPPVDAWLKRDGSTAVVGCYTSRQSWTLRCVDSQWVGVIGNCTRDAEVDENGEQVNRISSTEVEESMEVIVIVTIAIIGLAVCVIVIVTGMVCWKRYYTHWTMYSMRQKYFKHTNSTDRIFIERLPKVESA